MANSNVKSVFLHLRLPFSIFLLPVFLFAISTAPQLNIANAIVVFIVLHLFTYPASNGYNSYFDKDEGSIALIKNPPKVNYALYLTSVSLEWFGVLLALLVSWQFCVGVIIYNFLSKAYSHPSVRLKKYAMISFLVVFIFQGAFIYYLSFFAISDFHLGFTANVMLAGLICSCLIGATYPLTQIYQHEEDGKRGDVTLSIKLGYKGSFIFSGLLFLLGTVLMFIYWKNNQELKKFWVFVVCGFPVIVFFTFWFAKVWKDQAAANFKNMMRMTLISSSAMLIYFSWLCFSA
jgi:1,4-dihydroxy-2-naphthoate octaprenyltransferase